MISYNTIFSLHLGLLSELQLLDIKLFLLFQFAGNASLMRSHIRISIAVLSAASIWVVILWQSSGLVYFWYYLLLGCTL